MGSGRGKTKRTQASTAVPTAGQGSRVASAGRGPLKSAARQQHAEKMREAIVTALDELVVRRRDSFSGFTAAEIAEEMGTGVSAGSVAQHLRRLEDWNLVADSNGSRNRQRHWRLISAGCTNQFDFGVGYVGARQHHNGGGWVASSASVSSDAYVGPDARVYANARVTGEAIIGGHARVWEHATVSGSAVVSGDAEVGGDAEVSGHASVSERARVREAAEVINNARVYGDAVLSDRASVTESARVGGAAEIRDSAVVTEASSVGGRAAVSKQARVGGEARIQDQAVITDQAEVSGNAVIKGKAHVGGRRHVTSGTHDRGVLGTKEALVAELGGRLELQPLTF